MASLIRYYYSYHFKASYESEINDVRVVRCSVFLFLVIVVCRKSKLAQSVLWLYD
jgi:hypothetical protein